MNQSGWEVLQAADLIKRAGCIPQILAFYILSPYGYDDVHAWRNRLIVNGTPSERQLADATWLLLVEDVNDPANRYVLRKAGSWFDGLLARYPGSTVSQLTGHYHIKPRRPILYFPHAASPSFWRPLAFDSKNESALLSGEVGQDYPLRVAARPLLTKDGLLKRRTITTRTTSFKDPQYQAREYAAIIARFHIAIAGCRQFRRWLWPVAKHFEIMAAGTAMLTDAQAAQYLRPLGLLPGQHYLESSPDQLNETLQFWLAPEQRKALRIITARGHRIVSQFHMGDSRARHLNQLASALWATKDAAGRCPACAARIDDITPRGAPCALLDGDL